MASYYDRYGIKFTDDRKTLVECPENFKGEYSIPGRVVAIEADAFLFCEGLTSITIPNSVIEIRRGAFQGCSGLTTLNIPDSVKLIEGEAFLDCSNLIEVTIGYGIVGLGDNAFAGCDRLTTINIPDKSDIERILREQVDDTIKIIRNKPLGDYIDHLYKVINNPMAKAQRVKTCPKCKMIDIPYEANFCPECGTKL